MCVIPQKSGESPTGFLALPFILKTLQGHPGSHWGALLVGGQCVHLNSCVREGCLPAPFLPALVLGCQHWHFLLSTTGCPSVSSPCHLPGWAGAACRLPDSLPLTCRLPHAHFLCHQFGSVVPSPAAHSLAFLTGVLSNPWHQQPGSGPWLFLRGKEDGTGPLPTRPIPRWLAETINRQALSLLQRKRFPWFVFKPKWQ